MNELLIINSVALGDARASSDRPVPRPATKDTPQRDTLTRANTVEESRLSPEIIQAKHRLSVLNEQKAHHLGST